WFLANKPSFNANSHHIPITRKNTMPDPIILEDQVQALTRQLADFRKAQSELLGDVNDRLPQLIDQQKQDLSSLIDTQNTRFEAAVATLNQALSDLAEKSMAHRVSLPFNPK